MPTITAIPAFTDNYIWMLSNPSNQSAVVVDPGDAAVVEQRLADENLKLTSILITHHHMDHVGGVRQLVEKFSVPVYGPANENIPKITQKLGEGDSVELPELGITLQVFDVPGHTAGHIAYYCAEPDAVANPFLLCGDTLFSGGCGRLFEGTPEQMYISLRKFAQLPQATAVYCTHEYTQANLEFAKAVEPGNSNLLAYIDEVAEKRANNISTVPSTIARELAINPFLRCDQAEVIASAENFVGSGSLSRPAEVLKAIRSWKDNF